MTAVNEGCAAVSCDIKQLTSLSEDDIEGVKCGNKEDVSSKVVLEIIFTALFTNVNAKICMLSFRSQG